MDSRRKTAAPFRVGAFRRRIAWVFGLQFLAVAIICVMGIYDVAPMTAVIAVIVITTILAWSATRRGWLPVRALARIINRWDGQQSDPETSQLSRLSTDNDADVAALASGLHGFATRIAGYNQRERNFTRDASHELRSPLTVIKMSADMLADEDGLSDFVLAAARLRRIKRATREMEALVEALLILARESDTGLDSERFVVNDVLRHELESARQLLVGRPIELELVESVRFAQQGSSRVFSVLCWHLFRYACQQTEPGRVVISRTARRSEREQSCRIRWMVVDASRPARVAHGADRHGFELAIAQRISERFSWPLELQTRPGHENIAHIRFPHPLPAEA